MTAPGQFPELQTYPKNLPVIIQKSVDLANGPDGARQSEYLQHVQDAITAATENTDTTVAGLPNPVGWVMTPASGKAKMPLSDFSSLGDVGGNTFYNLLTGQLPKAKPPNPEKLEGQTLLQLIRHHADVARANAAKKPVPPHMKLHHQIMQLVRPQFSVAPIPGSAARPGGATRFGGGAGSAAAAHGVGQTSYAPRSASPFQGGANGLPTQQAPASTPAVHAGIGGTAAAGVAAGSHAAPYGMAINGAAAAEMNVSAVLPQKPASTSVARHAEAHRHAPRAHPGEFTREEERMIIRALEEDSRLPPRGYTGFDPALTPAWPGRSLRF